MRKAPSPLLSSLSLRLSPWVVTLGCNGHPTPHTPQPPPYARTPPQVWIMEHYLGTGIELGLFQSHLDLTAAFWYKDFLLSTQISVASAMRETRTESRMADARKSARAAEEEGGGEKSKAATVSVVADRAAEENGDRYHHHHGRGKRKGRKGGGGASSAATSAAVANNGGTSSASVVHELSAAAFPSTLTNMTTTREEDAEDDMETMLLGLRRNLCRGIMRVSRRQRFWVVFFRARDD